MRSFATTKNRLMLGAICLVLIAKSSIGQDTVKSLSIDDTNSAIRVLLTQIQKQLPSYLERDAAGGIISVTLHGDVANDQSLALVSNLGSIRELRIQVIRGQDVTRYGIAAIAKMTNLVTLRVCCSQELNSGVFQEICGIASLRRLSLVAAWPPESEYGAITNLKNLEELRISYCPNFGDKQLSILTNMVELRELYLDRNAISAQGTNVLQSIAGLTNVVVKFDR